VCGSSVLEDRFLNSFGSAALISFTEGVLGVCTQTDRSITSFSPAKTDIGDKAWSTSLGFSIGYVCIPNVLYYKSWNSV
jgi:hypothetical protein